MQTPEIDVNEFLSNAELCALLHVTPRTTARWRVEDNGLEFIRVGKRRVLYRRADVHRWLAQRTFAHRAVELEKGAA